MKQKKKFYVVWQGQTPGVYDTWEKCLLQVKSFPNAKYKSFSSKNEAEEAFQNVFEPKVKSNIKTKLVNWRDLLPDDCLVVDAACSGNPGLLEYQGVNPHTGERLFHVGPLKKGTNNLGEFLAIVHALAWLKNLGKENTPVYSDSETAMKWVFRKHPATKLVFDVENAELQKLVKRAVDWLHQFNFKNPLLKWETEKWGENPADFGRK